MADPRTDFFSSGAGDAGSVTMAADPRTAFFASNAPPAAKKPVVRESSALPGNPINDAVGGFVRQTGANMGAAAMGGVRGLMDIATGRGSEQAARDIEETQANALGYRPKSAAEAAGARASTSNWNPLNWIPNALSWTGHKLGGAAESMGAPPAVSAALDVAPTAAATVFGGEIAGGLSKGVKAVRALKPYEVEAEGTTPTAQQVVADTVKESPQSMGAAAASPRISNASPQLQHAVVTAAQKTGGAINPDAMARHLEADTLPVPVQLTEGQALQDPGRISAEQNLRGQHEELRNRFNEQNGQLAQNLQAMRDEAGPDVFTTNAVEHGDTLIKSYQDKARVANDDIAAKYQALRDANNGDFPADPKQLVSNATAALKKQMLSSKAPTDVMATLKEAAERGSITLDEFETARTRLAQIARSASDGQERYAAGVVRQEMEKLPLSGNSAKLKGLADDARGAAKAQFQALEADPAYKAAVEGTVPPDRFVSKFVTGGTRDNVALMRKNLEHDPVATQTMGVAAIDSLRDAAGIKPDGTGNFSQAGYNKQRLALDPKARSLLSPEQIETVEKLGNVARYTQFQPRGSFVNNSNTFVASAAQHVGNLAEGMANAKTGIPLASMARSALSKRAAKAEVKRMLSPGAGLDVLEEKK